MKVDISAAAQMIAATPKPLILIDTCSLLDVVRVPSREEMNASQVIKGASDLANLAARKDVHLAVTSIVRAEFEANLEEVRGSALSAAAKFEKQVKHYILSTNLAGLPVTGPEPFQLTALTDTLTDLAKRILAMSLELTGNNECSGRAMQRVITNLAPASKGKGEAKDCDIVEHYLELSNLLRQAGFSDEIIFVTTNKNDYGAPGDAKPPLDSQFASRNIEYVNNFQWAVGKLS